MPLAKVLRESLFSVERATPARRRRQVAVAADAAPGGTTEAGDDSLASGFRLKFHLETQHQLNWCWASMGLGFARFHGTATQPASQCQLAGAVTGAGCCPPGTDPDLCNRQESFSIVLNLLGLPFDFDNAAPGPISFAKIVALLNDSRPICVQIAWPGGLGGHLIAVYGFSIVDDEQWVWIRDPLDGFSSAAATETDRAIPYDRLRSFSENDDGPAGRWIVSYYPKKTP